MFTKIIKVSMRKLRDYISLIKIWQTGLLLVTGLAGYLSVRQDGISWQMILTLLGSLFLAISGSTVLNMVFDRDIDLIMQRTSRRPIPAGTVSMKEGLILGIGLSVLGVGWGLITDWLYGLIVLIGLLFDMLYTLKLKRTTAWSILWGGIAGGMPVLAGRTLATGALDLVGVLLALAIVFWIPTHIVTFAVKNAQDYQRAKVPVLPNRYGIKTSHRLVTASTTLAIALIIAVSWIVGLRGSYLIAVTCLGVLLLIFAIATMSHRFANLDFILFKAASVYMLTASILIVLGVQLA